MKKLIASALILSVFVPAFASAATGVSLASSKISVSAGQTFSVVVTITPSGDTVYTSKVTLSYPSDMVEPSSFTFAPTWLALSQPGYDSMGSGMVVKTAGYPGGLSSSAQFGTVTFVAKKAGTATISVGTDTSIYNQSNQNVYNAGGSKVNVGIIEAVAAPAPTTLVTAPSTTVLTPAATASSTVTSLSTATTTDDQTQVAAVAKATNSTTKKYALYGLLVVALIGIGISVWRGRKIVS